MTDFLRQMKEVLRNALTIPVAYKSTSKYKENYCIFEKEIFDKSFDRYVGQLIITLNNTNIEEVTTLEQNIINVLDNYTYATVLSTATLHFVTSEDISDIKKKKYTTELRFDFDLYLS